MKLKARHSGDAGCDQQSHQALARRRSHRASRRTCCRARAAPGRVERYIQKRVDKKTKELNALITDCQKFLEALMQDERLRAIFNEITRKA
jgi:hypothetical protein